MKTQKKILPLIVCLFTISIYMACNEGASIDVKAIDSESVTSKSIDSKLHHAKFSQIKGSLSTYVATIISNMPKKSEDNYKEPYIRQLYAWEKAINSILAHNFQEAVNFAGYLNYELIRFVDDTFPQDRTYYILKAKSNGVNHWGTYIYYPNYCRPLVIQSPHPFADANTGEEGIHIFKETEAQFFCLAGTHRCNSLDESSCDGETKACNESKDDPAIKYKKSDMSHNINTAFQKTTEILFSKFDTTYFIQLHGFNKKGTDPYVILSNGTNKTPVQDYHSIFKSMLFNEDNSLTFKTAHLDLNWNRLRGFKNKQGRLINNSSDPCKNNANTTTGRFFHIEQEEYKLRANINGWDKVAKALNNTFLCE